MSALSDAQRLQSQHVLPEEVDLPLEAQPHQAIHDLQHASGAQSRQMMLLHSIVDLDLYAAPTHSLTHSLTNSSTHLVRQMVLLAPRVAVAEARQRMGERLGGYPWLREHEMQRDAQRLGAVEVSVGDGVRYQAVRSERRQRPLRAAGIRVNACAPARVDHLHHHGMMRRDVEYLLLGSRDQAALGLHLPASTSCIIHHLSCITSRR